MIRNECGCGRPAIDATLCSVCSADLETALNRAAALAADLDTQTAKLTKRGDRTVPTLGRGATNHPLPLDMTASDAAASLRDCLASWSAVFVNGHRPALAIAPLARFLSDHIAALRQHEAAGDAADEISRAVTAAVRVIDLPPERLYAGPCGECGEGLYAKPGQVMVTCRRHDPPWSVSVEESREWMLGEAAALLSHAAGAVRILGTLGLRVTPVQVSRWAQRERLLARGTDDQGRPMYRVGDIADLAAEALAQQGRRQTARPPTAA